MLKQNHKYTKFTSNNKLKTELTLDLGTNSIQRLQ